MSDPNGPWQQEGGDHRPQEGTPRHLPSRHRAPAEYDLGYGAHARPFMVPDYVQPVDAAPPDDQYHGAQYHDTQYDTQYDDTQYDDDQYDDDRSDDRYDDPYDDDPYDDDPYDDGRPAGGVVAALRVGASEAAWRYRSAPLWARVTADLAAAGLVLVLIVGVSLALRQDDGPQRAAADSTPASTSTTTSTTVASTTTTVPSTTTTAPTTTTSPPTTTTTAPPVVPPPTEPPTTAAPTTTTTTEPVSYRDCGEAMFAGALPLYEGEPGYSPRLDRDHDGEACEWDDWRD